jgi:hypothetical protein
VEWDSTSFPERNIYGFKADPSLKSFLFALKNPHNVPAPRFPLKAEYKDKAIIYHPSHSPDFQDITVFNSCNAHNKSSMHPGHNYTNDARLGGSTLFTGSHNFQVKEIEVFEITD